MNSREIESSEYSSLISGVRIDRIPTVDEDRRRTAVEIFSSSGLTIRDSKILMVNKPPEDKEFIIGGHWEQGVEIIFVQQGEISTLRLADVDSGAEEQFEHLPAGTRIFLPPHVAHQFRFRDQAPLLVFNEVPFTPAKLVVYHPWAHEPKV